jgi:hypothetical protein
MAVLALAAVLRADTKPKPIIRDMDTGYLLNCSFRAIRPYPWKPQRPLLTGWETDGSGGVWESSPKGPLGDQFGFHVDWFRLRDTSSSEAVTIKHQIARQVAGEITLEFRFKLAARMDGASWQLRDLDQPAVSIVTGGTNLCYQDGSGELKPIQAYEPDHEYGVKAVVDLDVGSASIYVDGRLRASRVPLLHAVKTLDYVLVKTGDAATGDLYVNPVNIYKGYNLLETFLSCAPGPVPAGWQTGGTGQAAVETFRCAARPDILSLKLTGAEASREFKSIDRKAVFAFRFLTPVKTETVTELRGGNAAVLSAATRNGDLGVVDEKGRFVPVVKDYVANLWYDVKLIVDPRAGKAAMYVNGKAAGSDVPCRATSAALDNVRFAVGDSGRVMWVDDVKVYPWRDDPADYVPEPVPCPSKDHLVGVISCSLWKEGDAYAGWDYIRTHADKRKPYLGWYDEGKREVADWEIKWQVEHGIDFEQYCWYRPNDAVGQPIKEGVLEQGIREGLFNAKYSHLKKFTIMYTNQGAGRTNPDDWKRHLIPYWIEYFFKDPRYLKVDGKPVFAIYQHDAFLADFGGQSGAAGAIAELREACKAAGLKGCIVLMELRNSDKKTMSLMKAIGVDYCFAYTWYTNSGNAQRKAMLAQKAAAESVGLGMLASTSVGWDRAAWMGDPGTSMVPVEAFRDLLRWAKDEFMPSFPADSLGNRLVLMPNWNEFGEGHFMMPSAYAGFGYVDAVRAVFTEGGPHEDAVPTEKQKSRFTVLYPRD